MQWLVSVNTSTQLAKKRKKDTKCSAIDSGLHHSLQGPCDHRREGLESLMGQQEQSKHDRSPAPALAPCCQAGSGLSSSVFGDSILGSLLSQFPKEELGIILGTWNKMF